MDFIAANFEPGAVTITDFTLLPFGKKVVDQAGQIGQSLPLFTHVLKSLINQ